MSSISSIIAENYLSLPPHKVKKSLLTAHRHLHIQFKSARQYLESLPADKQLPKYNYRQARFFFKRFILRLRKFLTDDFSSFEGTFKRHGILLKENQIFNVVQWMVSDFLMSKKYLGVVYTGGIL